MGTPPVHRLAEAAARHIAETGQQPVPINRNDTGLACRLCYAKGNVSKIVGTGRGAFKCVAVETHYWADNDELVASNPVTNTRPKGSTPAPADYVALPIHVPPKLKEGLQERFGERLDATACAILQAMVEPGCFIVRRLDAERIKELTGTLPKNGRDVVGAVFEATRDRDVARQQLQGVSLGEALSLAPDAPPAKGTGIVTPDSSGSVMVDLAKLGVKILGELRALAVRKRESVAEVTVKWMSKSVENNWID